MDNFGKTPFIFLCTSLVFLCGCLHNPQPMMIFEAKAVKNIPMAPRKPMDLTIFLRIDKGADLSVDAMEKLVIKTAIGEGFVDVAVGKSQQIPSLEECNKAGYSKDACQNTVKNGYFVVIGSGR